QVFHTSPVGDTSGSLGAGGLQKVAGSQPPLPSAACQPDANSGSGTKSVRRATKRKRPRKGRSGRDRGTAPPRPTGKARRRVAATSRIVLGARPKRRPPWVKTCQARG